MSGVDLCKKTLGVCHSPAGILGVAILTKMPVNKVLSLPLDGAHGVITLLETGDELLVERSDNDLQITIPERIAENSILEIKITHPAAG